jgi:hypothetical protein
MIPETVTTKGTSTSEAFITLSTLYSNRTEASISTPFPEESSSSSEAPPLARSEETTQISEELTSATSAATDKHLRTDVTPSEQPLTSESATTLAPYPVITPVTEEIPSENITVGEEVTPISTESSSEYPITFFLTTSPKTPDMITGTTTPTVSTSTDFTDRYPSSTEMPDCSVIPCHNGGTCIHTKEGPRVSTAIITSFFLHILQQLTDV